MTKKLKSPKHFEISEQDFFESSVSNRSFGLFMAAASLIFSVIGHFRHHPTSSLCFLSLSLGALTLALFFPNSLTFFNRFWMGIGKFLEHIVNPIVLGLIFYAIITPIGLLKRLSTKDFFGLESKRPDLESYWVVRDEANWQESFPFQF